MENILKTLMKERGGYRLSGSEANKLTRECLQKALVCLMKELPFEKISVTELVKKSGVSRQSFYRNYRFKEDILRDMWQNIYRQLSETVTNPEYGQNSYRWYYDIFTIIKENGMTIELLGKAKHHIGAGAEVFPLFRNVFTLENREEYYRLLAYEGALNTIINDWFSQGMKEEVSYMAELCNSLFGTYHRELLRNIPAGEACKIQEQL